ncbi:MAG: DUF262 domain-containing protein [Ignavibacterium sp.]|nr:MAG: DUF262 domain-containing protein [Ignavibacterium sp.]
MIAQLNDQKRKVDFNTYDISVKELISMVSEKIIDIAPEYQRQFRWKPDRQSLLVESIFLGIPIPSLFMATNRDGSWELIDGVQRISSIIHYAGDVNSLKIINTNDHLVLEGLNKLSQFNDKKFSNLPKSIQLDFLLKPIKVTTLSDKSDLDVRFDLFERLNTGGVRLTDQEIRSCIYRGRFNDFLKELAKNKHFKSAVKLPKPNETDGTREEFVLRFFAFYYDYKKFDHSVVDFLNSYMSKASKNFDYSLNEELFISVFEKLALIPNGITRKRKTTPTNLFEAVAVGAALAYKKNSDIKLKSVNNWIASTELTALTTGATNSRVKVKGRIEYCRDRFLGK